MNLQSFYHPKDNNSWVVDVFFYFVSALLLITIFCYFMFAAKVYLQNQKLNEINGRIFASGAGQQIANEEKLLAYKKKIDDFALIMQNHKVSSNLLTLIETTTLPNVWFSNFDMARTRNEVRLLGEAKDLDTLGRQVAAFENTTEYVSNVSVLNSQQNASGRVSFTLDLLLNPKIYNYGN